MLRKLTKADWTILFTVIPVIIFGINFIFFGKQYYSDSTTFLKATAASTVVGVLTWLAHTSVALYLRHKPTRFDGTGLRITYAFLLLGMVTIADVALVCWIYDATHFLGYTWNSHSFLTLLSFGLFLNIVATSFEEGMFSNQKISKAETEAALLRREAMIRQLDNLNSQVNPHFLFNSLNNLSALIHEDPEGADQFVQELSSVYRYMLKVNDMKLVTLEEELAFLRSYEHLLNIRHGEGFSLHTEIDPCMLDHKLPPLTLQLLIENAVKHNKVLRSQPLKVLVQTVAPGKLVVRNNLQRKTSGVQSTRLGLKNIAKKYTLLNQPGVVIEEGDGQFTVTVPLLTQEQGLLISPKR
jgi:hypothetical protein